MSISHVQASSDYGTLQQSIDAIPSDPQYNYSRAKARCWLDASYDEKQQRGSLVFVRDAFTRSRDITTYIQQEKPLSTAENPAHASGLAPNTDPFTKALHRQIRTFKQSANIACIAPHVACAEVALSRADSKQHRLGTAAARPFKLKARHLLELAALDTNTCAPMTAALRTPVRTESTEIRFADNDYQLHHADSAELNRLHQYIVRSANNAASQLKFHLIGHADSRNRKNIQGYNERLSERRAEAVMDYLVAAGVPLEHINLEYKGDRIPIDHCDSEVLSRPDEIECMTRNRRVEIHISFTPKF